MCLDFIWSGIKHVPWWQSILPYLLIAVSPPSFIWQRRTSRSQFSVCCGEGDSVVLWLQLWDMRSKTHTMELKECDDFISDMIVDQEQRILLATRYSRLPFYLWLVFHCLCLPAIVCLCLSLTDSEFLSLCTLSISACLSLSFSVCLSLPSLSFSFFFLFFSSSVA